MVRSAASLERNICNIREQVTQLTGVASRGYGSAYKCDSPRVHGTVNSQATILPVVKQACAASFSELLTRSGVLTNMAYTLPALTVMEDR